MPEKFITRFSGLFLENLNTEAHDAIIKKTTELVKPIILNALPKRRKIHPIYTCVSWPSEYAVSTRESAPTLLVVYNYTNSSVPHRASIDFENTLLSFPTSDTGMLAYQLFIINVSILQVLQERTGVRYPYDGKSFEKTFSALNGISIPACAYADLKFLREKAIELPKNYFPLINDEFSVNIHMIDEKGLSTTMSFNMNEYSKLIEGSPEWQYMTVQALVQYRKFYGTTALYKKITEKIFEMLDDEYKLLVEVEE